jgi:Putative zinc-finger
MSAPSCRIIAPTSTLIAYWLGELDGAVQSELEEHLFGCEQCSARLHMLVQLGEGIRRATLDGNLHAIVTAPFINRLHEAGFSVREYRMQPGGSVMCTVAPDDDLVVAHLHASLGDVQQLDIVYHDLSAGTQLRMKDVAFDPSADEVVLVPNVAQLRQVDAATSRAELIAVGDTSERVIGVYTFNHTRYGRAG